MHIHLPILVDLLNKMALIFSRSTYSFYLFKFRLSPISQISLTSSPMMNGPTSPDLSQLDYQVWGQC